MPSGAPTTIPTRAPRVLLSGVVLPQTPTGVGRHNDELLPRLARLLAEHEGSLHVLTGSRPPTLAPGVETVPSRVVFGPAPVRYLQEGRALRHELAAARAAGRPYDLVHTGHLPAPRGLGVPYTFTLHHLKTPGQHFEPLWRRALGARAAGRALRHAARAIVVSAAVRDQVTAELGVPADRVHVVPNAADHLPTIARRAEADAPLVHVGQITRRKNLGLLLQALARDTTLPAVELIGHGRAREVARLRRIARELGITERVRFLGAVSDQALAEAYARAACVVFPSRCEGFGIPALEAQRAGAPLAASGLPALREVTTGDVPMFEPDDVAGCAAAIRRAIRTPAETLRERADAAGRYAWDHSARAWFDALREAHGAAR